MTAITKTQAEALYETLSATHATNHICRPESRLVVEGYPRSSNSFAVDMLVEAAGGHLNVGQMGHHTHDIANLQIAEAYRIPKLILIRDPEAAILSFHIYSGAPIMRCAKRYGDFYLASLELRKTGTAAAHFNEVTNDFGKVVAKVNGIGDFNIPEDQDFDEIRDRALASVRSRASTESEVAAPNEKREAMKNEVRDQVQDFLAKHPRALRIYERVLKRYDLNG